MYFTECVSLAERYPDLARVIEQVDERLHEMGTAEVIRVADVASFLGIDPNRVTSVLEMLAQDGVLLGEEMIECPHCRMAVLRSEYEDALKEEGEYRCTDCDRPLPQATIQAITTYRRGERWKEALDPKEDSDGIGLEIAEEVEQTAIKEWPDPTEHTTAKVWTTKDRSFWMSTKTDGEHDGKVQFAMREDGSPTYQMQFMRLICFQHPKPVLLKDVMEQVYPNDFATMGKDQRAATKLLRKVRSLVSDIRTKKFAKANLNRDILPPLSFESSVETGISLQLAKLHRLDDKVVDDVGSRLG